MELHAVSSNEGLNKILIDHRNKKLGAPTYDEFNQTIKVKKQNEDLETIIKSTRTALQSLLSNIEGEIKAIVQDLADTMFPNMTFESSLMDSKIYASNEFANAIAINQIKPKNLEEILKLALEHKRPEFVFYTLDLYKKDSKISESDRLKVKYIGEELDRQLGIKDMQEKKKILEVELTEVREYLNLLNFEYGKFEAKINSAVKVAKAMKESGQLEAETILLS